MPYPACINCRATDWGAKNDSFCNLCERDWYRVLALVFRSESEGPNPMQEFADSILLSVLNGENVSK